MRVLVAGSHGLIGTALTERLGQRGDHVVRLVRSASAGRGEVRWDPIAGNIDREALTTQGPYGAVVNLAGAGIGDRRWSPARRAELTMSRVQSTGFLVSLMPTLPRDEAETDRRPVLVNASAVGYYGNRGDEELTEESSSGSGFLAGLCRQWEQAAAPAESAGSRLVILRSGVVLTRRGGALARQLPLFRAGLGGQLGDGRQVISWITLEDEVGVWLRALDDQALSGPVNATAPEPVSNAELTAALGRALRRPAVLRIPSLVLHTVLGEMADELLLSGQRVRPSKLTQLGHRFVHADITTALQSVLSARTGSSSGGGAGAH